LRPYLLDWHYVATLENGASQPTVAALSDNSFVVGYEKAGSGANCRGSGSCLAFEHYRDATALLGNSSDKKVVLNRTLSSCNEGTPNIYAATLNPDVNHSIINVGFHYFSGCNVDRQATGTLTNFSTWKVQTDSNLNTLFTNLGTINGNVGDRDALFYQGRPYSLVEAQSTKNDFGSWRPYLFDRTSNSLTSLTLDTDGGSTSFGNPTYTDLVLPSGTRGFIATQFIFSEGAAPGEAGPLFYYRSYPTPACSRPDTTKRSNHPAGKRLQGHQTLDRHHQGFRSRQCRDRKGGVLCQRRPDMCEPVRPVHLHLDGPKPSRCQLYHPGPRVRPLRQHLDLIGDRDLPLDGTPGSPPGCRYSDGIGAFRINLRAFIDGAPPVLPQALCASPWRGTSQPSTHTTPAGEDEPRRRSGGDGHQLEAR
jgi:hypothetical protein